MQTRTCNLPHRSLIGLGRRKKTEMQCKQWHLLFYHAEAVVCISDMHHNTQTGSCNIASASLGGVQLTVELQYCSLIFELSKNYPEKKRALLLISIWPLLTLFQSLLIIWFSSRIRVTKSTPFTLRLAMDSVGIREKKIHL